MPHGSTNYCLHQTFARAAHTAVVIPRAKGIEHVFRSSHSPTQGLYRKRGSRPGRVSGCQGEHDTFC
jgi:hypothetical protein